jgi:hypothetical protein
MACRIGPGKHTLTLVDSWGNQVVRVVRVVK